MIVLFKVYSSTVALIMRSLDPQGPQWRLRDGTKRRVFDSEGPFWSLHFDNWDKLKEAGTHRFVVVFVFVVVVRGGGGAAAAV